MFKQKYTLNILDSKWNPIKTNVKFNSIPFKNEFIYYIDKYYIVLNVVHKYNEERGHSIFIIVEEFVNKIGEDLEKLEK